MNTTNSLRALLADRIEVTKRDGSKQVVVVRDLSVRGLLEYAKIADDAAAVAELLTGEKPGWADTIINADVYRIVNIGEEIIGDPFGEFAAFQKARSEKAAKRMQGVTTLPVSSPASASPQG